LLTEAANALAVPQACLRLKGENGIMRKKFQALQKDIEEQREQLTLQHEQQKELYNTIKGEHINSNVKADTPVMTLMCRRVNNSASFGSQRMLNVVRGRRPGEGHCGTEARDP
jgi:site-specific DNA-adenine methylase